MIFLGTILFCSTANLHASRYGMRASHTTLFGTLEMARRLTNGMKSLITARCCGLVFYAGHRTETD